LNNFSSSTEDLAIALKDSAAVLKTQGNDLYQAVAMITAGNAITQDASKTAGGIRTISLRLAGTEEAKEELESLGESVDDYVVQTKSKTDETIRNLTAVASNAGKGISVLDKNGNLRETYNILLDISKIYKEIQEEDKKHGTNRANALVEYIAGKNRSNIASSILLNGELLASVYEETLTKSQGSVAKEMESQLASIESHLAKLKNAWDKLWVNDNNREVINFFLDLATGILEAIDKVGLLQTTLIGLGVGLGAKKIMTGGGRAKSLPSKYATESFSREVCEININVHWYANI
jgi:TP901 family phage tail tape measure protein